MPLINNHEKLREKIRKTPVIKWFRSFIRFFNKIFVKFKPVTEEFTYSKDYGLLLLIPKRKM